MRSIPPSYESSVITPYGQTGQALLETLSVALGLAVLWVAISWLAHYQDAALSATHASGYAAFLATRQGSGDVQAAQVRSFFSGSAHRWVDRRGNAILDMERNLHVSSIRHPLSPFSQPGQAAPHASALRREWSLEQGGILQAEVGLRLGGKGEIASPSQPFGLRLNQFDRPYPYLARSTAILTGSGHAASDQLAQTKVSESQLAWSLPYDASVASGRAVVLRTSGLEEGWGRPAVSFDWLHPWDGYVPQYLLSDYEINGKN